MTTIPPENSPWGVPAKLPPLGLAYVGGALEKAGFEVQILDNYQLRTTLDFVRQEVQRLKPEIVGITCGSVTYRRCMEMAKIIKEVVPSCKVVIGGWHASYLPETALQNPEIDYAVMGEGEKAMVELSTQITQRRRPTNHRANSRCCLQVKWENSENPAKNKRRRRQHSLSRTSPFTHGNLRQKNRLPKSQPRRRYEYTERMPIRLQLL